MSKSGLSQAPKNDKALTGFRERATGETSRRSAARRGLGARRATVYDREAFASAVRDLIEEVFSGVVRNAGTLPPKQKRSRRAKRDLPLPTAVARATLQRWYWFDRSGLHSHNAVDIRHLETFRAYFLSLNHKLREQQSREEAALKDEAALDQDDNWRRLSEMIRNSEPIRKAKQQRLRITGLLSKLDGSLHGPLTKEARARYDRWLDARVNRLAVGTEKATLCDPWQHGFYVERVLEFIGEIAISEGKPNVIDEFTADMDEKGHEPKRIRLSVLRIIEPLVEAQIAGPIERAAYWKGMRHNQTFFQDLKQFLKQGIARERFMLDRLPSDVREISEADWRTADPYFDSGLSLDVPDESPYEEVDEFIRVDGAQELTLEKGVLVERERRSHDEERDAPTQFAARLTPQTAVQAAPETG